MPIKYFVYIFANSLHERLYIGFCDNLSKDACLLKTAEVFVQLKKKYVGNKLLWYEVYDNFVLAKIRDDDLRQMNRIEKEDLIAIKNPNYEDLFVDLIS